MVSSDQDSKAARMGFLAHAVVATVAPLLLIAGTAATSSVLVPRGGAFWLLGPIMSAWVGVRRTTSSLQGLSAWISVSWFGTWITGEMRHERPDAAAPSMIWAIGWFSLAWLLAIAATILMARRRGGRSEDRKTS
jgi:hypothetical protein